MKWKWLWEKFMCMIGDHDLTSKAEQGIKPTAEELKTGIMGFNKYAQMYCKRKGCDYVYKP